MCITWSILFVDFLGFLIMGSPHPFHHFISQLNKAKTTCLLSFWHSGPSAVTTSFFSCYLFWLLFGHFVLSVCMFSMLYTVSEHHFSYPCLVSFSTFYYSLYVYCIISLWYVCSYLCEGIRPIANVIHLLHRTAAYFLLD